jgi:hypothetical protein
MTDRLATLMHGEVETLDVPPPPAAEILGAGRRLRRRRTRTIWGGAALAVAVVAGGSALVGMGGDGHGATSATQPATQPPPADVAWGAGDTVYVGTDGRPARMPEVAQTLYYTSAGVLVRTNKDGSSDGGAPFHFQLVNADGTATKLDVTLGEVVPSTDPTEPYLAWATKSGGRIQVVVHDVTTDQDVATVDVPGRFDWGGWDAPPVALSGDHVYVGTNDRTAVVDWRTGEATTTDVLPGNQLPQVSGGRSALVAGQGRKDAHATVVDVTTGRDLLDVPIGPDDSVQISPDGRFLMVTKAALDPPVSVRVYDVATGDSIRLPDSGVGYGWTSAGDLFQVSGNSLTTCPATGGSCSTHTVPPVGKGAFPRYAGTIFES